MANPKQRLIEKGMKIPSQQDIMAGIFEDTSQPSQIITHDPNAIVPQSDGSMTFQGFVVTPVGVAIPANVSEPELVAFRDRFQYLNTAMQWLVGDLANSLKTFKGDGVYDDLATRFDKSPKTVREWAYVCANVHLSIRMDKPLTFKHHQAVAPENPEAQSYFLQQAAANGWSVEDLKEQIRLCKKEPATPTPALPTILERFARDFTAYRKGLKAMGQGERAELRKLAEDLISQIDQMG